MILVLYMLFIDLNSLSSPNFFHECISFWFVFYELLGERDGLQSQTAEFLVFKSRMVIDALTLI